MFQLQNEAAVPSFEEVIGRLYRSNGQNVADLVTDFPEERRARLALFCYGRAHMREIGVAVAATCDELALYEAGGIAGKVLFSLSRERPVAAGKPIAARHKVSLATLTASAPVPDYDPDPEPVETLASPTHVEQPQFVAAEASIDEAAEQALDESFGEVARAEEQLRVYAEAS